MLKLIKLEWKKNNIGKYIRNAVILAIILCTFLFALAYLGIANDPDTGVPDAAPGNEMISSSIELFTGMSFLVFTGGNYLVPLFATSEIREISPSGQLLKSVKVDGNPFSVAALDNCNYLVACGDAHCFIELNFETGDIVRKVNANDIEGAQLFFVAQLLPKRDGGLYICNWQGHDGEAAKGHYPQLIEINGAGKMVWDLNDNATFGMISSICPID